MQTVLHNAKQLFEGESNWFDKWQGNFPQLNAFLDAEIQADKIQALKVVAWHYTDGDTNSGYTYEESQIAEIDEMFDNDANARLFLDLMVVYRTLESFDPFLTAGK